MFYYSLAITAVCSTERQRYTHSAQWDRSVGLALFMESDDNKKNIEQEFSAQPQCSHWRYLLQKLFGYSII